MLIAQGQSLGESPGDFRTQIRSHLDRKPACGNFCSNSEPDTCYSLLSSTPYRKFPILIFMKTECRASPVQVRHDWARDEVRRIYSLPLPELLFRAQTVHREFHCPEEVQLCRLLSIKTGGCPEDCAYCPQSARYETGVARQELMEPGEVLEAAKRAREEGATRFCMGAAWRQVPQGKEFEKVLEMVRSVAGLGLEVCCTLGMLTAGQAMRLKEAGLTAYNHNLDTSPEFYGDIITTRAYEDRLRTIAHVRGAGITVCCGGILGMGESEEDRIGLLQQLSSLNPHPESVPINRLVRAEGTPLARATEIDSLVMVRAIATARILMPASRVRLAAGRQQMSQEAVMLCLLAGANSIFTGERLLTTPNPAPEEDKELLKSLGLRAIERA
jgi:biotin synthase